MLKSLVALPMLAIFLAIPYVPMDFIESNTGNWPDTWPNELEPLRKLAVSGRGGAVMSPFHEIKFSKDDRESFESAWPHLLSLRNGSATLTLIDGDHYYQNFDDVVAGVRICPPLDGSKSGPLSQAHITLMVDGNVIDLNRIKLPPNTPIEDARVQMRCKRRSKS